MNIASESEQLLYLSNQNQPLVATLAQVDVLALHYTPVRSDKPREVRLGWSHRVEKPVVYLISCIHIDKIVFRQHIQRTRILDNGQLLEDIDGPLRGRLLQERLSLFQINLLFVIRQILPGHPSGVHPDNPVPLERQLSELLLRHGRLGHGLSIGLTG